VSRRTLILLLPMILSVAASRSPDASPSCATFAESDWLVGRLGDWGRFTQAVDSQALP